MTLKNGIPPGEYRFFILRNFSVLFTTLQAASDISRIIYCKAKITVAVSVNSRLTAISGLIFSLYIILPNNAENSIVPPEVIGKSTDALSLSAHIS